MSRTPEISVTPEVLKWAREQRALSVELAAKRAGVSESKLAAIESGEANPSIAQLRKLGQIYRRPMIVLLLDEVPTTFQPLSDYRRLPDSDLNHYSPELLDEIKRAEEQQKTYVELAQALDISVDVATLPSNTQNVASLAGSLRSLLGVTDSEQRTLASKEEAFGFWRSKVESLGILVLETSRVKMSEMRGFSLVDRVPPVIVLNGQDSPRGKIFTLLHELCHLCLRDSGVCDLHSRPRSSDDVETFCNAVAAATILPETFVRNLQVVTSHEFGQPWTQDELTQLRGVAGGASTEAVLRRLVDLGLASREQYESERDRLLEEYEEFRKHRSQKSTGGPPRHRMQLRDRGRPFVRSVFEAYSDGVLTLSDVSDLVGLRVKHLDKLQEEAFR